MFEDDFDPDNHEIQLVEPFDTGDISHLSADTAFVLGVEWQMIKVMVDARQDIKDHPFHSANRQAVESMLKRRRLTYKIENLPEVPSADDWLYLTIIGDLFPFPVSE